MRSSSSMRQPREGFAAEYPGPDEAHKNITRDRAEHTKNILTTVRGTRKTSYKIWKNKHPLCPDPDTGDVI